MGKIGEDVKEVHSHTWPDLFSSRLNLSKVAYQRSKIPPCLLGGLDFVNKLDDCCSVKLKFKACNSRKKVEL